MDELLIKVRLDLNCDQELIKYFESVPKRRRAEQARRLILDGLRSSSPCHSQYSASQADSLKVPVPNKSSSDDDLFSKDMKDFN